MLEKYGHSVQIVENGQLAVEAVKQCAAEGGYYDVILVCAPFQLSIIRQI